MVQRVLAQEKAMEAVKDADNLTVCINKLKRVKQRLLSGQSVQPTVLLPIRHFITYPEQCRR